MDKAVLVAGFNLPDLAYERDSLFLITIATRELLETNDSVRF